MRMYTKHIHNTLHSSHICVYAILLYKAAKAADKVAIDAGLQYNEPHTQHMHTLCVLFGRGANCVAWGAVWQQERLKMSCVDANNKHKRRASIKRYNRSTHKSHTATLIPETNRTFNRQIILLLGSNPTSSQTSRHTTIIRMCTYYIQHYNIQPTTTTPDRKRLARRERNSESHTDTFGERTRLQPNAPAQHIGL